MGVFGHPIHHSLSPAMHNAAFAALGLDYIYVPFPVCPDSLGAALHSLPALGILGVNLTIPHKERVLPFLEEISDEAREVGAVNTVHCVEGRLLGENTDSFGFYAPLEEAGLDVEGRAAVVLGAGGAARSVVFALLRHGGRIVIANRAPERAERLAEAAIRAGYPADSVSTCALDDQEALGKAIDHAALCVNATRLGMYPDVYAAPKIPWERCSKTLFFYDLVYNPVRTRLLQEAEAHGCPTLTGVRMLVYQGAAAFQKWTGHWPPVEVMEQAVLSGLSETAR